MPRPGHRRPAALKGARTGRTARASGERAEAVIVAACDRYRARGLADVYKRPTPVKPISGGSPFRAVWQAKAGCDFGGTLAGGRSVLVELKTSSGPSLPLERHGKPTLGHAQAAELERCDALGGLAGVLVKVQPAAGPRWFWLAWGAWQAAVQDAADEGRASLGAALLEAHGVEVDPRDWLAGVT